MFSPVFPSRSFILLGSTFRSMIFFELIFVYSTKYGSKLTFLYWVVLASYFLASHLHLRLDTRDLSLMTICPHKLDA